MDHGSIYGIPTVHVVDFHGELVDEYTRSHGSYGKVSRVLKIPGCRASIPQYLWSKFGPTCRSRNRLMDFTRGGIWLILGICLPIFDQFQVQQMRFILARVLPSLKLCMEVFVGSLLIPKFALISLPFEGPWSFLQWLCWCQPCKLSTVQYMLYINNLPKIQSNPSKSCVH